MSFFATPYIITGSLSLYLSYKTYNAYYNQPFEYIEIEDNNSLDDDGIHNNTKSDLNSSSSNTDRDKQISDKGNEEDKDNKGIGDNEGVGDNEELNDNNKAIGNKDLIKFDSIRDFVRYEPPDDNLQKAKNKYIQNIIDTDKVNVNIDIREAKDVRDMPSSNVNKLDTINEETEEEIQGEVRNEVAEKIVKKVVSDVVDEAVNDKIGSDRVISDKVTSDSNILLNRYNKKGLRKRKKKKKK